MFVDVDRLQQRVRELGAEIVRDGPDDVLLVTLLNGGLWFMSDLARRLTPDVEVDFLRLSPYPTGENPPGSARIVKDLDRPVGGRHVLIVEDVIDTGLSLAFLMRRLEASEPASIRVCTLLDRTPQRIADLPIAYRGFEIDKEYLVGYGLDVFGYYRNLPALIAIEDLDALRSDPLKLVDELVEEGIWDRFATSEAGDSL